MLAFAVLLQLVLTVVFRWALEASKRLELHMSFFVIVAISDGGEPFEAKLATVGSLACMDSQVDLEVTSLVEVLVADLASELLGLLFDGLLFH